MSAKRLYIGLVACLCLTIVLLLGATRFIGKALNAEAAKLAASKSHVVSLSNQQAGLAGSKRDIAKYKNLERITSTIVPQDKDQAETVREITNIASANRVPLTTVTFPSSTLGNGAAAVNPSAAAVGARPNLSQLAALPNIPGVYNLQITIGNNANNTVSFSQLNSFLAKLENNRRTAAVSSISIQPQASNPGQLVFTLIINTYLKPS